MPHAKNNLDPTPGSPMLGPQANPRPRDPTFAIMPGECSPEDRYLPNLKVILIADSALAAFPDLARVHTLPCTFTDALTGVCVRLAVVTDMETKEQT
ncbi:hypothetical protein PoB_007308700 [Plakobranchus ocellatus]|uniref:Uncharacterized protein n=1 Tax=Plakobranchus ocellatus TaxID=259542 RepID=A0AAV4DR56_9GAST|nr:hypothetical protein PoB_007308700 [Plakobranchus ocellatus]